MPKKSNPNQSKKSKASSTGVVNSGPHDSSKLPLQRHKRGKVSVIPPQLVSAGVIGPKHLASLSHMSSTLNDGFSYRGQQVWTAQLPCEPLLILAPVGGTTQFVYNIDGNAVLGFTARFGATFDEFRILGCHVEVHAVSTLVFGLLKLWFDEKTSANPTSNESQERIADTMCLNASSPSSGRHMTWYAKDLLDLQYTPIGTITTTPVYWKCYTDTANWAYTPNTVITAVAIAQPTLIVEFRGLRST